MPQDFHHSLMGERFYQHSVPELIKTLKELNDTLTALQNTLDNNALVRKERFDREVKKDYIWPTIDRDVKYKEEDSHGSKFYGKE